MRVVTVGALDQAFVDPVMKRHVELRLLLQMARVAERRLGFYQEKLRFRGMVGRMT